MWKNNVCTSALLLALALTGCQKSHEKATTSLRIDFQEGDLPSLHPHALMIYLRGISISKTLFEGLTRIDAQGKVQLAGAKSIDISDDRLRYTFTLRDNKWSNGDPVTAFHYENAWKEALSPISACSRADLLYMIKNAAEAKKGQVPIDDVGVKAVDEKTLVVELAYPSPYFLELLGHGICAPLIDPKKKEPSEFNGPFMVEAWKKGEFLRLKPNAHFWDSKQIVLKQIDVFMVQDVTTAFSLFEKKEIDWIGVPLCPLPKELISHLEKVELLKSHPVDRAMWVFLNTEHPSLASPAIRQALSLAIDRSAITKHVLSGGIPLAKALPLGLLPLPLSSSLKEDLREARQKFEQGLQELGLTRETFPPLVIAYSQQANRKQLAEYLQQAWSGALGIKVNLQAQEWTVLRSNLEKGFFEISGALEAAFYKDPLELLERFTSINPTNFSRWVNTSFKEKLSLAKQERDPQLRMQLLSDAEQLLVQQMPFIPICSDVFLFAHHPDLRGYAFDCVGAIDFSHAYFKSN